MTNYTHILENARFELAYKYRDFFKDAYKKGYDGHIEAIHKVNDLNISDIEKNRLKGAFFELLTDWMFKVRPSKEFPYINMVEGETEFNRGYDYIGFDPSEKIYIDNNEDRRVFKQDKFRGSYGEVNTYPKNKDDEDELEKFYSEMSLEDLTDRSRMILVTNVFVDLDAIKRNRYMCNQKNGRMVTIFDGRFLRDVIGKEPMVWKGFYDSLCKSGEKIEYNEEDIKLYLLQKRDVIHLFKIRPDNSSDWKYQTSCVIAPTGVGKTIIEIHYVKEYVIPYLESNGVIVVTAPTIALCHQLLVEYMKYINIKDINVIIAACQNLSKKKIAKTKEEQAENELIEAEDSSDEKEYLMNVDRDLKNVKNATGQKNLEDLLSSNIGNGKKTIVFSTYRSMENTCDAIIKINGVIDVCVFDEAHKLVKETDNFNAIKKYIEGNNIKIGTFFTATPAKDPSETDNGVSFYTSKSILNNEIEFSDDINLRSFSNSKIFGKTYDVIDYNDAVNYGYICRNKMTIITYNKNFETEEFEDSFTTYVKNISRKRLEKGESGFRANNGVLEWISFADGIQKEPIEISPRHVAAFLHGLKEHVKNINVFNKGGDKKAKVIFFAKSVPEAEAYCEIIEELSEMVFGKENSWKSAVITSGTAKSGKNGGDMSRREIIEEFGKDSNNNRILCHYNTLTEGIDVPACTGVFIGRKLDDIALAQAIGRGCRRTIGDKKYLLPIIEKMIEDGKSLLEILKIVNDDNSFEKPYNDIMIIDDQQTDPVFVSDFLKKILNIGVVVGEIGVCYSGTSKIVSIGNSEGGLLGLDDHMKELISGTEGLNNTVQLYFNRRNSEMDVDFNTSHDIVSEMCD